jgi:hypothetical protein
MKRGFIFSILFLSLILSACVPIENEQVIVKNYCGDGICSENEMNSCFSDCDVREKEEYNPPNLIPIEKEQEVVNKPAKKPSQPVVETPVVIEKPVIIESFEQVLPSKSFSIARTCNYLNINDSIEDFKISLDAYSLPDILRAGYVQLNSEPFGYRRASYDQHLRLIGGEVVFDLEEDSEIITDYLFFEEETPIFDYRFYLRGGLFKFFEGQTINILGYNYIIEHVGSDNMVLIGVDTPDSLFIRNQRDVKINGKTISRLKMNVTLEEDMLRIIINAPDEIKLLPGQRLSEFVSPYLLLTNRIDLEYQGLGEVEESFVNIDKVNNRYSMKFSNNKALDYNFNLLSREPFIMGSEDHSFIFQEGSSKEDYVIEEKDYFIVSNNRERNGFTHLLRLESIKENLVSFTDKALEKFLVYYQGTPGYNATGNLVIDGVSHKFYVSENESMSMDLDGNGRIKNDKADFVTLANGIFELGKQDDYLNVSFKTPASMIEDTSKDLVTNIIIDKDKIKILNIELYEDWKSGILVGMDKYGNLFLLKDDIDKKESTGKNLLIAHPFSQRKASAVILAYE